MKHRTIRIAAGLLALATIEPSSGAGSPVQVVPLTICDGPTLQKDPCEGDLVERQRRTLEATPADCVSRVMKTLEVWAAAEGYDAAKERMCVSWFVYPSGTGAVVYLAARNPFTGLLPRDSLGLCPVDVDLLGPGLYVDPSSGCRLDDMSVGQEPKPSQRTREPVCGTLVSLPDVPKGRSDEEIDGSYWGVTVFVGRDGRVVGFGSSEEDGRPPAQRAAKRSVYEFLGSARFEVPALEGWPEGAALPVDLGVWVAKGYDPAGFEVKEDCGRRSRTWRIERAGGALRWRAGAWDDQAVKRR